MTQLESPGPPLDELALVVDVVDALVEVDVAIEVVDDVTLDDVEAAPPAAASTFEQPASPPPKTSPRRAEATRATRRRLIGAMVPSAGVEPALSSF